MPSEAPTDRWPLTSEHEAVLTARTWQLADDLHWAALYRRAADDALAEAETDRQAIIELAAEWIDPNWVSVTPGADPGGRDAGDEVWNESEWGVAIATVEAEHAKATGTDDPHLIHHDFLADDWLPRASRPHTYPDGQLRLDGVSVVTETADPVERLAQADRAATAAVEARKAAILDAARAGVPLTVIAQTLGISHEGVRKVVRAAGL